MISSNIVKNFFNIHYLKWQKKLIQYIRIATILKKLWGGKGCFKI